jgi:HK97 family phage major capsid protein
MDLIKQLKEARAALKVKLEALNTPAEGEEVRSLNEAEKAEFQTGVAELKELDERIAELQEAEVREARAAAHHVEIGTAEQERRERVVVTGEANPVYRQDDASAPQFFRDLAISQLNRDGAPQARERLAASQETRAGDMTTVAGAGGEFAPPSWLVADFVALARAGRVTADLCNKMELPSGVSSVNLPKVASGVTVAVQATQNSALSETAMTTTSVSSGITTVGGKQIISMQLLQQSGIPFDRVILQDLAKAYAIQIDNQVLYGSNASGQVKGLVSNATNNAFTTASPAPASVTNANSLYYVTGKAKVGVRTSLFEEPDAIVMHPARWGWIEGAVDANGRPFVVPDGSAFNPLGADDGGAQGPVGRFCGLPVYVDPNISTAANSATNQDEIYVLRRDAHWLWESPVQTASFDATYADDASVLFRILGYMAFIGNRISGSAQSIRGTGLVAP